MSRFLGGPERQYAGLLLLAQHEKLLAKSGISPEVAAARGYRSVDRKAALGRLGFAKSQQHVPALVVPVWSTVTGQVAFHQARPDLPRMSDDGKTIKYETPANVRMAVDAHPMIRAKLGDTSARLWVTEGVRKADALVSAGEYCVALLGVWNWRGRNEHGGTTALPDWEAIARNGRDVYLAFDSDVMLKREVHAALRRLAAFLKAHGARVYFVYLPEGEGGAKAGVDDYLAAGHTVADLLALATDELRAPASGPAPALADLLDNVAAFLRRFVAFASPHQGTACALWTAHTHVYDRFDVSPYLCVTSPEKQSGKTRLQETLDPLVRGPWRVVSPSGAVLYRKIHAEHPTLLLDEVDAVFGRGRDDAHEPLRALLNAGNRRGVTVPRCEGDGAKIRLVEFDVFTPRVLAGIGALPDTIADRGIPIRLQHRAPQETVEPFRFRQAVEESRPIREGLERWVLSAGEALERARPETPVTLNDRAAEIWEPLLAIADLAGGDWPRRAREAAVALHGDPLAQGETLRVNLLRAIRETFERNDLDRLTTADLIAALVDRDDGPWAEWWEEPVKKGNIRGPAARLGRMLRPLGIEPKTIRLGDERTSKGYIRADLRVAFVRYLPSSPPERRHNVTTLDNQGREGQNEDVTTPECDVMEIARQSLQDKPCDVVTFLNVEEEGGANATEVSPGPDVGAKLGPIPDSLGDDGRTWVLAMGESLGWPSLPLGSGRSIAEGERYRRIFAARASEEDLAGIVAALGRSAHGPQGRQP